MATGRIDYRMQRRALLAQVREGTRAISDVCDAHPNLVRAGEHLGDVVGEDCPICGEADGLRHVSYLFPRRGRSAHGGRAIASERIADEVLRLGTVRRFVVEVCPTCHWNHVLEASQLERPTRPRPRVAPRRA